MLKSTTHLQIGELKQRVYANWEQLHRINQAYVSYSNPTQDETFKREIRTYGDLRYKSTWEKAFAAFEAKTLWDYYIDSQELIELYLIRCPRDEGWVELVPQVVEQYAAIPGGWESIVNGLKRIFQSGSAYETTESDVLEFVNGITRLAAEQLAGTGGGADLIGSGDLLPSAG